MVHRRQFLGGLGVCSLATLGGWGWAREDSKKVSLDEVLESVRKEHQLPGIAGAVMKDGQVVAEGAAGVRELGKNDAILATDRFMIGSCTKRMTRLLIARLIDAGLLTFETTLADALPGVKMRDEYKNVTITQLMTFTGGIQPYTQIGPRMTPILFEKGPAEERRMKFLTHVLNEEPVTKPGGKAHYSNAGFAVLAEVAARAAKKDYQTLMAEQVFAPLKLEKAGFGRPRTKERPNEPWYHVKRGNSFVAEPDMERPPEVVLAAAGGAFCTVIELAMFAAYELAGATGKDPLLKPETAKKYWGMINPSGSDAIEAGGSHWLHAMYTYSPKTKLAIAVAVNAGCGDPPCEAGLKAVKMRMG